MEIINPYVTKMPLTDDDYEKENDYSKYKYIDQSKKYREELSNNIETFIHFPNDVGTAELFIVDTRNAPIPMRRYILTQEDLKNSPFLLDKSFLEYYTVCVKLCVKNNFSKNNNYSVDTNIVKRLTELLAIPPYLNVFNFNTTTYWGE